ncbi:hypothetical protein IAU60_000752 [Kwoniella sp. DSM 27419]
MLAKRRKSSSPLEAHVNVQVANKPPPELPSQEIRKKDDKVSDLGSSDFGDDLVLSHSFLEQVDALIHDAEQGSDTALRLAPHISPPAKRPGTVATTPPVPAKRVCASSSLAPVVSGGQTIFPPRQWQRNDSTSSTATDTSTTSAATDATTISVTTSLSATTMTSRSISHMTNQIFAGLTVDGRSYSPLRSSNAPYITVTPHPYQKFLDRQGVTFHVQWELSRLLAMRDAISWDDVVCSDLQGLNGTAKDAMPRLSTTLNAIALRATGQATENRIAMGSHALSRILMEVDREEVSIRSGDLRGVGNDSIDWPYGGKINYTIAILPADCAAENVKVEGTSRCEPLACSSYPFRMALKAPDMPGKSCRLARRFGSRRVITFSFKGIKEKQRSNLADMLVEKVFVVLGRPYRAFWGPADTGRVFAIETDELVGDMPKDAHKGDPKMPSLEALLHMFNDLEQKPKQAMAKWAARPQILFSDSVPVATVQPSAIQVISDIVSHCARDPANPGTNEILTDGCGLMSEALALRIRHSPHLDLPRGRPSAIQMRIGGSKGLLALMTPEQEQQHPGKEVVLRESMVKSFSAEEYRDDPSLLTIDLVCADSLRIGTSLSAEPIIAMAHNGVPLLAFKSMMRTSCDALRDAFLPIPLVEQGETEHDVLRRIYESCYHLGGVGTERKKREYRTRGQSTRVAGLTAKWATEDPEDEIVEPEDLSVVDDAASSGKILVSGQPDRVAEALLEMVSSGFHPSQSSHTALKLHTLVGILSTNLIRNLKISVAQSLSAFIVPDSLGILRPDELFIAFSGRGPTDPVSQCPLTHLQGDVLAYRSPCKVPTDVRKFKAVWRPELSHLKDCIVLLANSRLCQRSPASYMGGGDYDGDTVQLIWDSSLVEPFTNASDTYADTPDDFVELNFDQEVVKGETFLEGISNANTEERVSRMQEWLLASVQSDTMTGHYSNLHGNAAYELGYGHEETIRLARMFCHILDARKSGLVLKPEARKRDMTRYSGRIDWRSRQEGQDLDGGKMNVRVFRRNQALGQFVMDELMTYGEGINTKMMASFPRKAPSAISSAARSPLRVQWDDMMRWPDQAVRDELGRIEEHVKACLTIDKAIWAGRCDGVTEMYQRSIRNDQEGRSPGKSHQPRATSKNKADDQQGKSARQSDLRNLTYIWHSNPSTDLLPFLTLMGAMALAELKLSCLMGLGSWAERCGFDIDFHGMCGIKAKACAEAEGSKVKALVKPIWEGTRPCRRNVVS